MTDELWRLGAVETARRIRDRDIGCREVMAAHLGRMAAVNPGVNAVVVDLTEAALIAAEAADRAVAAGEPLGPLHGVPVTIKENVDVEGQATPNGVAAFADVIAPADAPAVANLRRAGAIVIGRTNTPEFSYRWFTANSLRGATLNPWDAARCPGGSSGGAAASVALGIGAIAHGSDLGGSLRYPAYCCGVATIKPTLGRVPAYNPSAPGERTPAVQIMAVQGPIARNVEDARLGLEVMAGADARDPWQIQAPLVGARPSVPIRVAVADEPAGITADPRVRDAVAAAARHLEDAGYAVEQVKPPAVAEIADKWLALIMAEAAITMRPLAGDVSAPEFVSMLDVSIAAARPLDLKNYMKTLGDRTRLMRDWLLFLDDYPLVLGPVSQEPAFPCDLDLEGTEAFARILEAQRLLVAVNFLGLPAAAVPVGLGGGGLPTGVQIIGQPFREDLCLDAARAIEDRAGGLHDLLWEKIEP